MARISIPNSRIKGLQTEFSGLFQGRLKGKMERKWLEKVMGFIQSKNKTRTETFHYFTDAGGFRRWDRGTTRSYTDLYDVAWEVEVLRWEDAIEWDREDEEDLIVRTFRQQLGAMADKSILIDIEAFFQIIQATTDPDRLETVPNGADGLAIYSSSRTDFGGSGNVVTGSGVSTVAQIKSDFFSARQRINGLKDKHLDFYHRENVFLDGICILFNDANLERFAETFEAKLIQGSAAGIENIIIAETWAGPITLWPTPRITDDSWYFFAEGVPEKPVFALERRDLGSEPEQIYKDENNSDYCADNDARRMLFRKRVGYGVSLPQGTVQVNN